MSCWVFVVNLRRLFCRQKSGIKCLKLSGIQMKLYLLVNFSLNTNIDTKSQLLIINLPSWHLRLLHCKKYLWSSNYILNKSESVAYPWHHIELHGHSNHIQSYHCWYSQIKVFGCYNFVNHKPHRRVIHVVGTFQHFYKFKCKISSFIWWVF